ncbi:LytR/AlgR family response regulator transcription factor [Fluviicola taffensis]|uniref:Two component transcriptional regulator, LytTR family n=1 Tax=Fluviicola taffensis (strain DSM 16823 / NCIMB 13979 / RW262) TaxID=755732 RepID=F2I968_FLUTR|nr:LytTR family DNA-binding domain-containing protein [Fluviicola taffensis]AEA43015.1 two component transcriptional regulator, LytTR family [Fluviicola taffensis DSM 16823]
MNVLIIEDEESAFENLKRILLEIDPSINIVFWLQSVEQSIHWFETNDFPDLIFLDIQLSDDLSFKIFESVEVTSPIVFTTAFDEYAIKAFELNSIDYILKPISKSSIEKSITKYKSHINRSSISYNNLLQDLKFVSINPSYKERFLVNKADELVIVPTANISYFFKDNDTYIVLKNGDRYAVKFTLDELIHLLDPIQFYRVNRQLIVSIHAISKITFWFKGKLKLRLIPEFDTTVFVSREGATKFKAWMDK